MLAPKLSVMEDGGDSDSDDALSLRDLPTRNAQDEERRTEAAPPEADAFAFEFFSDRSAEMCAAEDVFCSGTILPYAAAAGGEFGGRRAASQHHRSRSLDGLFPRTAAARGSYRKLQRAASAESGKPGGEGCVVCFGSGRQWHLLPFGPVRAPPAGMEDIRSRQRRRGHPAPLFAIDGRGVSAKSSWRLLRALSCRDREAIAVA